MALYRYIWLSQDGMLRRSKPSRYIEIGSGISTRVANRARVDGAFPMEIVSIDPEPRIDVEALCDHVIRERLEFATDIVRSAIVSNSVVFFDGSHRCFPGSDVTVFFLEILPRLPKGTLVHIHDIFLPSDYSSSLYPRFWSEQYLLAAYLLGGSRDYDMILPCAYLSVDTEASSHIAGALQSDSISGSGFWMKRVS